MGLRKQPVVPTRRANPSCQPTMQAHLAFLNFTFYFLLLFTLNKRIIIFYILFPFIFHYFKIIIILIKNKQIQIQFFCYF